MAQNERGPPDERRASRLVVEQQNSPHDLSPNCTARKYELPEPIRRLTHFKRRNGIARLYVCRYGIEWTDAYTLVDEEFGTWPTMDFSQSYDERSLGKAVGLTIPEWETIFTYTKSKPRKIVRLPMMPDDPAFDDHYKEYRSRRNKRGKPATKGKSYTMRLRIAAVKGDLDELRRSATMIKNRMKGDPAFLNQRTGRPLDDEGMDTAINRVLDALLDNPDVEQEAIHRHGAVHVRWVWLR
jgi:hypothetical protein